MQFKNMTDLNFVAKKYNLKKNYDLPDNFVRQSFQHIRKHFLDICYKMPTIHRDFNSFSADNK